MEEMAKHGAVMVAAMMAGMDRRYVPQAARNASRAPPIKKAPFAGAQKTPPHSKKPKRQN